MARPWPESKRWFKVGRRLSEHIFCAIDPAAFDVVVERGGLLTGAGHRHPGERGKKNDGHEFARPEPASNSMIRWSLVDRPEIPGGGELRLMRRDAEFSIMLGTNQLMSSRGTGSEEAFATFSCDRIRHRKGPHILIGGLGMGFTLRLSTPEQRCIGWPE
jgi:hypothetical protein